MPKKSAMAKEAKKGKKPDIPQKDHLNAKIDRKFRKLDFLIDAL